MSRLCSRSIREREMNERCRQPLLPVAVMAPVPMTARSVEINSWPSVVAVVAMVPVVAIVRLLYCAALNRIARARAQRRRLRRQRDRSHGEQSGRCDDCSHCRSFSLSRRRDQQDKRVPERCGSSSPTLRIAHARSRRRQKSRDPSRCRCDWCQHPGLAGRPRLPIVMASNAHAAADDLLGAQMHMLARLEPHGYGQR